MRKLLATMLVLLAGMFAAPAAASAYLHVANAQSGAVSWVRYDVCDGWACTDVYAQSWYRYSDNRVDVYVHVNRASGRQCTRWTTNRGDDWSFYTVYATGSSWNCWG